MYKVVKITRILKFKKKIGKFKKYFPFFESAFVICEIGKTDAFISFVVRWMVFRFRKIRGF